MLLPDMDVRSEARPHRIFFSEIPRKFDFQPIWKGINRSNSRSSYDAITESLKQNTFEKVAFAWVDDIPGHDFLPRAN